LSVSACASGPYRLARPSSLLPVLAGLAAANPVLHGLGRDVAEVVRSLEVSGWVEWVG